MEALNFSDFPVLTTERLILRQLAHHDADQIHTLRSDKEVNLFIGRAPSTGVSEALEFIGRIDDIVKKNQGIYWAVTLKGRDCLVGTICYWNFDITDEMVEIGYELLPEFQGKGIMTEAIKRVIEYGFEEMKVKTITALPSADNTKSIALLRKTGFKADNEFRWLLTFQQR